MASPRSLRPRGVSKTNLSQGNGPMEMTPSIHLLNMGDELNLNRNSHLKRTRSVTDNSSSSLSELELSQLSTSKSLRRQEEDQILKVLTGTSKTVLNRQANPRQGIIRRKLQTKQSARSMAVTDETEFYDNDNNNNESDSVVPSMPKQLDEQSIPLEKKAKVKPNGNEEMDMSMLKKAGFNDPDKILKAVKCQINVRKNGELEVDVPGDPELSRKLENLLKIHLAKNNSYPIPMDKPFTTIKLVNLSTIPELMTLEQNILHPNVKKQMDGEIKRLGGKTYAESMQLALKHFLSQKLATEFNWTGNLGKKSFRQLKFTTVLFDSILAMYPSSTVYQLETVTKKWLADISKNQEAIVIVK